MAAARRDEDVPATLNQLTITRDEFLVVHKEIIGSTADERLRFAGLDARRVDLVVAGSMLLATAMELFDLDSLTISEWALARGDRARRASAATTPPTGPTTRAPSGASRSSASPGAATGPRRTPAPSRGLALELFDATAELHDPRSAPPTASCSSTPRCSTTSASTCRAPATTATAPTSCATASCAASRPTRSRCSPRSCAGTAAASHACPTSSRCSTPPRSRASARWPRSCAWPTASTAAGRASSHGIDVTVTPSLVLVRPRTAPADDAELEVWGARRKRMLLERVLDREVEFTSHPAGRGGRTGCQRPRCGRARAAILRRGYASAGAASTKKRG